MRQLVDTLLDSGAYANYLSETWAHAYLKPEQIQPVEGEYIQLGGTAKRLPVLGKTRLLAKIGKEHARIVFHICKTRLSSPMIQVRSVLNIWNTILACSLPILASRRVLPSTGNLLAVPPS